MKHCHAYKKQYSFLFGGFFIILFLFFSFLFYTNTSNAQTGADLINAQIAQRTSAIAALQAEIDSYQTQLDTISKQKSSLSGDLKTLDLTRKQLVANISITQNKIDKTNLQIEDLSSAISTKENSIANNSDAINLEIRKTNEFDLNSTVETLLSEEKLSSVWTDLDNMTTVEASIKAQIVSLKQVKAQLQDTKAQTVKAKAQLVSLKAQLADQKKIVDQNTAEKKRLLAQTKDSETAYQNLLADRLSKKAQFEKDVRDYESQLKYILDASKLPSGGVLSWPLDNIYVTQFFGKTEAGKRLYANGSHNGVDFRATVGTPVKAMADGVVAGTGDTDIQCRGVSFGRFILIKYDDGLASTFGHLSLIKVSTGQRVKRGEIIGYSGKTGYATGPHLHISIYPSDAVDLKTLPSKSCPSRVLTQPIAPINAYLDPMYYLPPYKN